MKVKELIETLQGFPQDLELVTQMDSEGNGYHKTWCAALAVDDKDNGYPDPNDEESLIDYYGDNTIPEGRVVVIV